MDLYFQTFLMIAAVSGFTYRLAKLNSGVIQVFELGFFYMAIVLLYFLFPITGYLLNDKKFIFISDVRLAAATPSPEDVAEIGWYYIVYAFGFISFYLLARSRKAYGVVYTPPEKTNDIRLTITIAAYFAISLLLLMIKIRYDMWDVTTYGETFVVYWQLPTIIRQLYNHLSAITVTVQISIIIVIFTQFPKYRYWVYGLILFELVDAFLTMHSRSLLFFTLFSTVLAYHYSVKQLEKKHIVLILLFMLLMFITYGRIRDSREFLFSNLLGIFSGNEFESVFGTLFDYNYNAKIGNVLAISYVQTWMSDLFNLIPQQFLPFEKVDISHSYSMAYIPGLDIAGGGFPGGALLEAIMGMGLLDAFLKSAITGIIFSYVYRKCMLEKRTCLRSTIYIWVMVMSYKAFSRGTFILVPAFFYDFVIPVAIIQIMTSVVDVALSPIDSPHAEAQAIKKEEADHFL
jgi:hypothetical protein